MRTYIIVSLSKAAMAKELDVTVRAIKKSIKELSDRGILKHTGSSRNGYWEVYEGGKVSDDK